MRAFASEHEFEAQRRLETRIGYGIGVTGTRGLMTHTPGSRSEREVQGPGALERDGGSRKRQTVGIEGTLTERGYERDARHAVEIRGQIRW